MDKYAGTVIVVALGVICIIVGTLLSLGPVANSGWIALALGAILFYAEWQGITLSPSPKGPGLLEAVKKGCDSLFSEPVSSSNPSSPHSSSASSSARTDSRSSVSPASSGALDVSRGGINVVKFILSAFLFVMGVTMALGGSIFCLVMFALALLFFLDVKKTEQRLMAALTPKAR